MIWQLMIDNTNFMTGEIRGIATMSVIDPKGESYLSMLKQMQEQFGCMRVISLVRVSN